MTPVPMSPRMKLAREAAVLQIKLLVDGLRDALLIPLSLLAALIGLLRGGADCDREYRRVIKLGLRSERWINLFGHQRPLDRLRRARSMDRIIDEVENVVVSQYRRGRGARGTEKDPEAGPPSDPEPGQDAGPDDRSR